MQRYLTEMYDMISDIRDLNLYSRANQLANPLNAMGKKCFSQTDEDGITLEIVKRLGLETGTYCELGVGTGLENNTLILASMGWSGFWVDVNKPVFNYKPNKKFNFISQYVNIDNIVDIFKYGMAAITQTDIDLISIDFESNDYYLVEKLLENNVNPKVFIVEYNAKFFPPIEFVVEYDANGQWAYDDYFGASLMSYVKLFEKHNYFLVCCNSFSGANAFFVRGDLSHRLAFNDIPKEIDQLWVEPSYYIPRKYGHILKSPRVVENIINRLVDNG